MAQAAQALREALWEDKTPPLHNLPPGHTWQYSRAIGGGAQGKAHLWVRLDESRKIVDRIVIKNFVAQSKHAITEDGPKGRIPTEAYISQLLVPDDSKDFYTVPILACQPISGSTGGWRTYSPYYSLGNFETLVEEHTKDAPLPEPFLWFFFYRMAKAAVAMDESLRKDDTGPVVIHNDIKLDNIFLGSPGSLGKDSDFVMYPPAYLGDFGLAFTIRLGEQSFGLPVGAFGWWPPEHHTTQHFRAHPFSYTNIWQIGFTILCAMSGTIMPDQPDANVAPRYDTSIWKSLIDDETFAGYSDDLLSLVNACLLCNPSDRIDPQSLLFLVENSMTTHIAEMQRWGTKSWIMARHNETEEEEPEQDQEEADDPGEDGNPILPASHRKRKSSGPLPAPKRVKGKAAVSRDTLQRRYALVAKQMQLGKTSQSVDAHPDDTDFVLGDAFKVAYSQDEGFGPENFFIGPDPGPIKYMTPAAPTIKAKDGATHGSA